jgi:hypothetical protein
MKGADFLAYLETSPETKDALLNMCRKRNFKKAVKKYSMEHNRGFTNDDLTKAFQRADSDNNGNLDIDEVRILMHAMDPSIPEAEIVELMKFIDVDADGKLSFRVSSNDDILQCPNPPTCFSQYQLKLFSPSGLQTFVSLL